ncbi:MAG: hypothetical protein K2W97_02570 [Chthoniobacterales bacterium]|nr:hypothetical protein [Chthoniobacterales bacterium]
MSSYIPRTDPLPSPAFDQLSSNLDEIPVTSRDSSSRNAPLAGRPISQASSSAQQSPRSILKSSSSGHTVTTAASEINLIKKSVSFHRDAPLSFRDVTDYGETSDLPTIIKTAPKADQFTLRTSEQIKDGAKAVFTARTQDLETATKMCNKFFNENPNLDKESVTQIKEKLSIIQDHATKAKKYSTWTTARHSLLQGNKELAKKLEETGYSIGSDWNPQQLQEDWRNVQEEPWATHDALFDLQKTIAAAISKKPSSKNQLPQQAEQKQPERTATNIDRSSKRQESEPLQRTYASYAHQTHEDTVYLPDGGAIDRNKYDIGNVEYHDDGTSTITDMHGTRYDYPPRRPSSDSCTVS